MASHSILHRSLSTHLRFRSSLVRSSSERQAPFSGIAPVYDNVRAKMGDIVLDLCCGSGDIAFLLSEKVDSNGKVVYNILLFLGFRGWGVSILDFNKSTRPVTASVQELMIDNVVVPVASGFGLEEDYKYLKRSIREFLTGVELEKLDLDVGFSSARYYEIGGGLMGNLVATC